MDKNTGGFGCLSIFYIGLMVALLLDIWASLQNDEPFYWELIAVLLILLILPMAFFYFKRKKTTQKIKNNNTFNPLTGEIKTTYLVNKDAAFATWEAELTVLWAGLEDIEFSYVGNDNVRERRRVNISTVLRDNNNNLYFKGYCYARQGERTFKVVRVKSKILHNGTRYERNEFFNLLIGS